MVGAAAPAATPAVPTAPKAIMEPRTPRDEQRASTRWRTLGPVPAFSVRTRRVPSNMPVLPPRDAVLFAPSLSAHYKVRRRVLTMISLLNGGRLPPFGGRS